MKSIVKSITLIDDESITNFVNKILLEKLNICEDVQTYDQASVALKDLVNGLNEGTNLPDIMFVDVNMPEMNGWDFIDEFCTHEGLKKRIKVFMLSSSQSGDDLKKAEKEECIKGFIGKPLTEEKVLKAIND